MPGEGQIKRSSRTGVPSFPGVRAAFSLGGHDLAVAAVGARAGPADRRAGENYRDLVKRRRGRDGHSC